MPVLSSKIILLKKAGLYTKLGMASNDLMNYRQELLEKQAYLLTNCSEEVLKDRELGYEEPVYTITYEPPMSRFGPDREIRTPRYIVKEGAPRPIADVQNEIATLLAHPKQYTARAKIGTREYTIQALSFRQPDVDHVWMARRDRIIQNMHQTYCRERVKVRDEIKQRQDELKKRAQLKPRTTSDDEE